MCLSSACSNASQRSSRENQNPRLRPISSWAMYSARPFVTPGAASCVSLFARDVRVRRAAARVLRPEHELPLARVDREPPELARERGLRAPEERDELRVGRERDLARDRHARAREAGDVLYRELHVFPGES